MVYFFNCLWESLKKILIPFPFMSHWKTSSTASYIVIKSTLRLKAISNMLMINLSRLLTYMLLTYYHVNFCIPCVDFHIALKKINTRMGIKKAFCCLSVIWLYSLHVGWNNNVFSSLYVFPIEKLSFQAPYYTSCKNLFA